MASSRTFRDPIHRTISFNPDFAPERLALDLLDTPPVQRLKHVRQLGLASLVYHGAEHSRFSHTIGVCHLAKRLYRTGLGNPERDPADTIEYGTVLASAVLHDVGHMPFSHAMEKALGIEHETLSTEIVKGTGPVNDILRRFGGEDFVDAVAVHIANASDAKTVGIVSGQTDADRMDYILRDGYYAGIPTSQFDLERIVQKARIDDDGLFFEQSAQQAIEGYLIARHHLYLQLYLHPTVRSAEAMMRAALRRAGELVEDGQSLGEIPPFINSIFSRDRAPLDILELTDHEMWSAFRSWARSADADPVLKELSIGLIDRKLYKVHEVPVTTDDDSMAKLVERARTIASDAGMNPEYSIIVDTAKDTPFKFEDASKRVLPIRLRASDGSMHKLEENNPIITALGKSAYVMNRIVFPFALKKDLYDVFHH